MFVTQVCVTCAMVSLSRDLCYPFWSPFSPEPQSGSMSTATEVRYYGHNKLNHHNLVVSSRLGNSYIQVTVTSRWACMGVCLLSLRFIDSWVSFETVFVLSYCSLCRLHGFFALCCLFSLLSSLHHTLVQQYIYFSFISGKKVIHQYHRHSHSLSFFFLCADFVIKTDRMPLGWLLFLS